MHRTPHQVTNGKWGVSYTSGSGINGVILHVAIMRENLPSGAPFKFQHGQGDGLLFPNKEAADLYALEHGYTQNYVHGQCPTCKVVHTFLGHRSGFCHETGQFV